MASEPTKRSGMSSTVEDWKVWCLAHDPADVVTAIVVPIVFQKDSQADLDMCEGLYLAAHERPEITQVICAPLALPNNPRLARILLKLSYDLWRVNPSLLLGLLTILYRGATNEVQDIIVAEMAVYKNGEDVAFRDFLLTYNF